MALLPYQYLGQSIASIGRVQVSTDAMVCTMVDMRSIMTYWSYRQGRMCTATTGSPIIDLPDYG